MAKGIIIQYASNPIKSCNKSALIISHGVWGSPFTYYIVIQSFSFLKNIVQTYLSCRAKNHRKNVWEKNIHVMK